MTTKDSILALAAKISNGTVPNVATDAQALGELAKAMCGTAPEVPLATVDDAIEFITANYSGGGGGVDVGNIVSVAAPNADTDTIIATLGDKQMLITDCVNADGIAAGMTVEITTHLAPPFVHGVTASYEQPDGTEGEFTDFTYTEVDATTGRITFVVPNLPIDDTDPSDITYSTLSFRPAD